MALEVDIHKKLKGFSLQANFRKGKERFGILGASGSGKSMTLKCIAGIETPDTGKIVLNNRILYDSTKQINIKPQKRKVGYLFQNYALFQNMTVEENIGAGLTCKKEEKQLIIADCINRFHLQGLEKRYPWQLSGGQQQRCALARILVYKPEMIMLDEPFSALDSYLKDKMKDQLIELLEDYQGDVIIVTHSRDEIYKFCEELVVMTEGKTLVQGRRKQIFETPVYAEAAKLTGCKNISPIKKVDSHRLYAHYWGMELETEEEISEDILYVGIRAHHLVPIAVKEKENCIKVQLKHQTETPFEYQYTLLSLDHRLNEAHITEEQEEILRCYVMKTAYENQWVQQGFQYVKLPKNKLILLK